MTNKEFLQQVNVSNSARSLVKVLKTVGKIDNGFSKEIFINWLRHENVEVRRLSIYNLGKITFDLKDIKIFFSNEKNSINLSNILWINSISLSDCVSFRFVNYVVIVFFSHLFSVGLASCSEWNHGNNNQNSSYY